MRNNHVQAADGEIAPPIATDRDVTKLRSAEDAQLFLAAIVDSSDDAIATYTPAGIILTWNHGAEAISGYSAREAIGRHASIVVPPERQHTFALLTERILQGNAVSQYEGVCLSRDGRRIPVSLTACPVRNADGVLVAISVILRDISERRESERARA